MRSKTREEELSILVKNEQPDVVLISEAELGPNDTVVIPGYTSFLASPAPSGKCRLFALIRDRLRAKTVVLATTHMDIWLRINLTGSPLTIVGVYRQWSNTESSDLADFYDRCASHLDGNRTIIAGDMNLDFGRQSDLSYTRHGLASEHFVTMEALGLQYAGPYSPTFQSHGRYKSASGEYLQRTSILDHVYTLGSCPVDVSVIPLGVTDHMPVKTVVAINSPDSSKSKWVPRRPFAKLSGSALCIALEQSFKSVPINIYQCDDIEVVHDIILTAITKALNRLVPYRMVPAAKPDRPPLFLAEDTLGAMRERDAAAAGRLPQYRSLRNKVCRLVRRDRLRSSLNSITRAKNSPGKLWSLARSFIGADTHAEHPNSLITEGGTLCNSEKELADTLNSFFINKITKIRSDISSCDPSNNMISECTLQSNSERFSFKYPSAGKIEAIISSLKNTGAMGVDGVPVRVLKLGAPVLSGPIAHLVRLSFQSARVPSGFKSAIVKPVYKGKGKQTTAASSYRPVAILPAMSKILERCAFETLVDFLETRLPAGQYGFRPGRSTSAAISDAHGRWSSARSTGHVLGVMGFDLTAAFDTIDARLLCNKLVNLGIDGKANAWFSDYLHNREQCVEVHGTRSPFKNVAYGVPQGSILGPVLFLAMVADMPEKTGLLNNPLRGYVAYADDICAWSHGDSVDQVKDDLDKIAASISSYAASNFLSLSAEKTQVLWSGQPQCSVGPDILVNGVFVKPCTSLELLGVKFDRWLNPAPFLSQQFIAAAPILAIVRRLTRYLPSTHVALVASAFLTGKLAYAAPATFVPRLSCNEPIMAVTNKLQICINKAARTILGSSRADRMPIEGLLAHSGLPSLNRLAIKSIVLECWRAINMGTPLGEVICGGHRSSRPTRLGSSNKLPPPFKFPRHSMAWHAVRIWNLHEDLRNASSLHGARRVAAHIAASSPL